MFTLRLCLPFLVLIAASLVRADGGFLRPITPADIAGSVERAYLDEPEQHAVLHFDGEREVLHLSVRYEGDVEEFGWIVPVPGRPEVELGSPGLVQDIARFEYRLRLEDWNDGRIGRGSPLTLGGGSGGRAKKPAPVRVIEKKRLGLFDVTVIQASDSAALTSWLNTHSFQIPDTDEARAIIRHYVEADMYFCALRVVARQTAKQKKWLRPLTITFPTERPFYPLRISALHARSGADSDVVVHAFLPIDELSFTGARRTAHPDFDEKERLFHGRDLPRCVRTFPTLRNGAYSLVTFDADGLHGFDMRDLWIATTPADGKQVEAEFIWRTTPSDDPTINLVDSYRSYLADYPDSPWAAKARADLALCENNDAESSALRVLARSRLDRDEHRYREAVLTCRRAAKISPTVANRAATIETETRTAEAAFMESEWSALLESKKRALDTKDAKEFFRRLVSILRLCRDVHPKQSLASDDVIARYDELAGKQMAWLERHHAHELNRALEATLEEAEWFTRRDAAKAQRGVRLLRAIAPNSAIGRKSEELARRMDRGLR